MRCRYCPNKAERIVIKGEVRYPVCLDCATGIDVQTQPSPPRSRSIKPLVRLVDRQRRTDREWRRA